MKYPKILKIKDLSAIYDFAIVEFMLANMDNDSVMEFLFVEHKLLLKPVENNEFKDYLGQTYSFRKVPTIEPKYDAPILNFSPVDIVMIKGDDGVFRDVLNQTYLLVEEFPYASHS